jgi:D-alanyl-D-alanine carboxypeptidase/D-alanyl-D-alanine-endopeptidase (penicillin-binding protein 4)
MAVTFSVHSTLADALLRNLLLTLFRPRRILLLLLSGLFPMTLGAADGDRLAALAGDGGVLLHSPAGEAIISLNADVALIPASVLKIPLSQVALHELGEDFRFETLFYRNAAGDLLIRGLGDPFLVSEEIEAIADILAERGLTEVNRLVMDDSAFAPELDLPFESDTLQPYGARNGALAVNFNTVNLTWSASGELQSAEEQTPLTPLARQLARQLQPGQTQRINVGEDPVTGLQQAQQLFRIFLQRQGITVMDEAFYRETVNENWGLFYRHRSSRSLQDNLEGLLRYSNNFIANQVFLVMGAQVHGFPATAEAARQVLQNALKALYGEGFGTDPDTLLMLEGSGLDRRQRSSARAIMRVLENFKPHASLLTEVDGALRKSGTLTGVYNFAGFIPGPGGLYPFVILTNQSRNNRARLLALLQREVSQYRRQD